jgi:hypothetical protein
LSLHSFLHPTPTNNNKQLHDFSSMNLPPSTTTSLQFPSSSPPKPCTPNTNPLTLSFNQTCNQEVEGLHMLMEGFAKYHLSKILLTKVWLCCYSFPFILDSISMTKT